MCGAPDHGNRGCDRGLMMDAIEKLKVQKAALLVALQNLVGAVTIKNPDIQNNIDDAYRAIDLAGKEQP
jgi:hypothetical protein